MTHWYRTTTAHVGLRLLGLGLLACVRPEGAWLHTLARGGGTTSAAEMALAALCFLSASAGVAMILWGPGLWTPVPLSERWTSRGL